jgi:sigma-B regulation protein RsbU (phosphoserine phosphatase)
VADVSGHGVPASFVTAIFKSSLYRMTLQYQQPDEVMFHLNNELSQLITTGHYVTGLFCCLFHSHELQLSSAGHPYPIWFQANTNTVKRLSENGTPLIWLPDNEYDLLSTQLQPNDKILLFTDGVSEMLNPRGELFGEERLEKLFAALAEEDPDGPC